MTTTTHSKVLGSPVRNGALCTLGRDRLLCREALQTRRSSPDDHAFVKRAAFGGRRWSLRSRADPVAVLSLSLGVGVAVHLAGRRDRAEDGGFYLAADLVGARQRRRAVEPGLHVQEQGPARPPAPDGG